VHSWPPSHTDCPYNITPLKLRNLSEQEQYTILDEYLVSKVDELLNISNSCEEYTKLLSHFESKFDSKSLSYSNGFVSLNYHVPFVMHPNYKSTFNTNLKPIISAGNKLAYQCTIMDDISKGELALEFSIHNFDPYPISELVDSVSAFKNKSKLDLIAPKRR